MKVLLPLQEEEQWCCCAGTAVVQHGGHISHAVGAFCYSHQSAWPCALVASASSTAASCCNALHSNVVRHLVHMCCHALPV